MSVAANRFSPRESTRPWGRALAWFVFLVPFFFITYNLANWLAAQRTQVNAIVFDWERHIPFIAWTIIPYWLIDLFYGLSLLLPRTRNELDAHAKRLLMAQIISVAFFILFPLRFTFEQPATNGVLGWLFATLNGFDKPFNQAPSLHISLLVILWSLYARYAKGALHIVLHALALLIGISVLTTYQHHFIDVPTGLLAGGLCVLVFPLDKTRGIHQGDPIRWRLGAYYLTGGIAIAAISLYFSGAALWLMWPASALTIVAMIYFCGNPQRFAKNNGHMAPAALLLLMPYLLGAWLNSRLWTWRQPVPREIIPNLWISRIPSRRDLRQWRPDALIDCCAELPVKANGLPLYAVPMLDLLVPEIEQIEQGIAALDTARAHGKALIFCALGYSRSALIVVAWLVKRDYAASINEAIATVQRAHPALVLSQRHRTRLEEWHAYIFGCAGKPEAAVPAINLCERSA